MLGSFGNLIREETRKARKEGAFPKFLIKTTQPAPVSLIELRQNFG